MQQSISDQILSQFLDYMSVSAQYVIPLGLGLQLYGVALVLRSTLRDDQYRKMSWVKTFGYAVMFVVGMPLVGQGLGAVLVWSAPLVANALNIMALLQRIFPVDQRIASVSQPWGYAVSLLVGFFYIFKVICTLRGRSIIWRPLLRILCVLIFSFLFFQIAAYAIFKLILRSS